MYIYLKFYDTSIVKDVKNKVVKLLLVVSLKTENSVTIMTHSRDFSANVRRFHDRNQDL